MTTSEVLGLPEIGKEGRRNLSTQSAPDFMKDESLSVIASEDTKQKYILKCNFKVLER